MSVANTSPRLGLILPTDSDIFDAADYTATFSKLDTIPGIRQVNSYAALVTLGGTFSTPTANHGSFAVQRDNGAVWWWNCPSGAGAWQRANSLGKLLQVTQGADVPSTTHVGNGTPIWASATNVTMPGGRPIRIDCNVNCTNDNSSGNGVVVLNLMMDSSVIRTMYIRPNQGFKDMDDGSGPLYGTDQFISYFLLNPSAGDVHSFNLRIRAGGGTNVQGNVVAKSAVLTVLEV